MISLHFACLFVCLSLYIANIKIVDVIADVFVFLFMVSKGRGRIEVNFISCLRLYSLVASHPSVCFLPYFVTMIDILIRLARICSLTSIWYLKSAQYLFVFTFGWQVIVDWVSVPVVTMIDNLKSEDFGIYSFRFCHLLSVIITSFGFVFVYVSVSCLVRTGVLAAHVRAVESRKAEPALCR